MHKMRYTLLASSAALVLMGAGCTTAPTADTATDTVSDADTTVSEVTVADTAEDQTTDEVVSTTTIAEIKTFDVVAEQFSFSPSTLTVNQGDSVVLNLTTSDVPHGFSLPEFGVATTITPGKTSTVEFVADQSGTFSFSCSVVCGAGHTDMSGTLVVNAASN